jgi:hypothetical protein
VERLAALREAISWPDLPTKLALTPWQTLHNIASNAQAPLFGQPHFFTPRPVNPLSAAAGGAAGGQLLRHHAHAVHAAAVRGYLADQ